MSGLPWIQVDANLPNHRKSIELAALVGDEDAWRYLVRLWLWASQNEPTGVIRGSAAMLVVERVCGWKGEPQKLASALVTAKWLDVAADGLAIHDWSEHQGAHIEKAKRDADRKDRWREARRGQDARATRTRRGQDADATRDGAGEREKEMEMEMEKESKSLVASAPTPLVLLPVEPTAPDPVAQVLEHYSEAMKANGIATRPTRKRRRLIEARLSEGFTPEQLKQAVDGLTWSDWHMGRDPKTRGARYCELKYCLGDPERVEEFIRRAIDSPQFEQRRRL